MTPKPSSQEAKCSAAQPSSGGSHNPALMHSVRWKPVVFSVGVVLACGFIYGLEKYAPSLVSSTPTVQQSPSLSFGLADYESLEPGMTLTEVRSILGKGIETSRSETEVNFVWRNPDGSNITAVFSGEKLKWKGQTGLQ